MSSPGTFADLGIFGVIIHLLGDAINNVAVMISAGVFMATSFIYADPIASAFVGLMILATSAPLVLKSGRILLEGAPIQVDFDGVRQDIARVDGIEGVHELHVWNLSKLSLLHK
jgi:solute carrier family 30 (zinc transporter), member 1